MTLEEKLALLDETFEADEGTVQADMMLEDIDEYDSMTKLSLIVMMEDEFGVKLTSDMVRKLKTVKDILDLMK
ncbi:acyl carrier protein [Intestinibacter sp.]|uniref:acyl carrier protein n=1 Tax=Intestinibacter sp. TaxID=1965304 RepID=UPI003F15DD9C